MQICVALVTIVSQVASSFNILKRLKVMDHLYRHHKVWIGGPFTLHLHLVVFHSDISRIASDNWMHNNFHKHCKVSPNAWTQLQYHYFVL